MPCCCPLCSWLYPHTAKILALPMIRYSDNPPFYCGNILVLHCVRVIYLLHWQGQGHMLRVTTWCLQLSHIIQQPNGKSADGSRGPIYQYKLYTTPTSSTQLNSLTPMSEYNMQQSCATKLLNLHNTTELNNFVAQLCSVSDMGLSMPMAQATPLRPPNLTSLNLPLALGDPYIIIAQVKLKMTVKLVNENRRA